MDVVDLTVERSGVFRQLFYGIYIQMYVFITDTVEGYQSEVKHGDFLFMFIAI